MKRIPFKDKNGNYQKEGCYANLTHTSRIMLGRNNKAPIVTLANFPRSLADLKLIIKDMTGGADSGLTHEEEVFFAERMWQLMTSCKDRRFNNYEKLGWWQYLEADRFSETYRHLLVEGLTRTLVASRAQTASTKTGGDIFLQLIFNMIDPDVECDRVLNGPTNDAWLNPWKEYLLSRGVKYNFGKKATKVNMKNGQVDGVQIIDDDDDNAPPVTVKGDIYLFCVPVERMADLINTEMTTTDPTLSYIVELAKDTSWMNGIQYYLNEDVVINQGHVIYSDSEWAVTSISQIQFWKGYDLSDRYNGKVKGILSVDISDWLYTKYKGVLAEDCEPEIVKKYVWEQMKASLNVDGKTVLRDEMIEHWYLDRDIRWQYLKKNQSVDKEPLLVNTVNSWGLRPTATTHIPNMFLAADYVRTNTDLATMEGANEAARRAVNCIIDATDSDQPYCKIYPLTWPWLMDPLKWHDKMRYNKGLPYSSKIPWWLEVFMFFWGGAFAIYYFMIVIKKFIKDIFKTQK